MHNRLALASDLASPFISAVYAPSSTTIPLTDSHSNSERSADRPRKEYGRSASLGNSYDFVHNHDLASLPLFFSRQSSLHQHPIIPSESCVSSTAFQGSSDRHGMLSYASMPTGACDIPRTSSPKGGIHAKEFEQGSGNSSFPHERGWARTAGSQAGRQAKHNNVLMVVS